MGSTYDLDIETGLLFRTPGTPREEWIEWWRAWWRARRTPLAARLRAAVDEV